MAREKKINKAASKPAAASDVYNVLKLLDASATIDDAQKKFKLAGSTVDVDARKSAVISTGMLCTDLMLNGGIYPGGWYTYFGPEGAAKSTGMMTSFISFFYSQVPIICFYDPEGSSSPDYIETIAKTSSVQGGIDLKRAFGVQDPKTGKYIVEPRIRYFPETSLEAIWKSQAQILRSLPDKVFIDGEWWLLFDNTKANISRLKGRTNTKIGGQFGKLAVPSLDGGRAQALFIVDSFASMISDDDDDEDGSNALGMEARGHSKHAKKVKGRLKRKHATVIGTNQLRDNINIGNPYGPKEREPGGNALKHYSDARIRQSPRAVPHASGAIEEEDSVLFRRGADQYRYIGMKTIKTKFGPPFLEMFQRIWLADPRGEGHGLCPVYDTWQYLKQTGQATGSISPKPNININLAADEERDEPGLQIKKISWLDFKRLILLTGEDLKTFCTKLGLKTNPKLRARCFEQLRNGDGIEKYFAYMHGLDEEGEDDLPYEEMDEKALRREAVDRELVSRKEARGMDKASLIEVLEEDDG